MKQIIYTKPNVAELLEVPKREPKAGEVCVKMAYTAISAGTERANLVGDPNVGGARGTSGVSFPRSAGYSGSGIVESVGEGVEGFAPGDRVITYWGKHSEYNTLNAKQVVKIPSADIRMEEAAFTFITTFPLAAVRKVRIELGESAMVVGLGILGLFAVQYARLSGAHPVIALDFSEARRQLALKLGADYAFDPREEGLEEKIRSLTGSGVNAVIEVTGATEALDMALKFVAKYARVALLGCTRQPATVDFYHDVHFPGVTLIGAHTMARPEVESFPGYWTHTDDCKTTLKYLSLGRLNVRDMISEIHPPQEAGAVFERLAFDKNFPVGVVFDWSKLV